MYTISEVVELGTAQELILSDIKRESVLDDEEPQTFKPAEYFDE